MVSLTDTEAALVEELLEVIDAAMSDLPEVDPSYANKTKLQKLLYLAIDEFDLPVTYSWYLAGAVIPDRNIGPNALHSEVAQPRSPPSPSVAASESSTDDTETADGHPEDIEPILFTGSTTAADEQPPTATLSTYVERNTLHSFYREMIPEVWSEQTMRFLQNFYQEMAPAEYRRLYIESTHLRTHLSDLQSAVERHLKGETPQRPIPQIRDAIEHSISDFHYYLQQSDQLRETFDAVVLGTHLIEDAILMLDQRAPTELTQAHADQLETLQSFFYYYVWKYPCLRISHETAVGPTAAELQAARQTTFETFEQELRDRCVSLETELDAIGLLPGPTDYPPMEDQELAQTIRELSSRYEE